MVTKTTLILTNILLLLALVYTANKEDIYYSHIGEINAVIKQYEERVSLLDQSKDGYSSMVSYFKANAFDRIYIIK